MSFLGGLFNFSGGGVGNSSSESKQQTENSDMRVVGGDSSINTSTKLNITGGTNTLTDYGSVAQALQLGQTAVKGAQANELQAMQSNASLFDSALHAFGDQQQQYAADLQNIKTGDKTLAIAGAVVVAALVAVNYFKGR
jgi:hypothetical protein